jgi:hypothetical protein
LLSGTLPFPDLPIYRVLLLLPLHSYIILLNYRMFHHFQTGEIPLSF